MLEKSLRVSRLTRRIVLRVGFRRPGIGGIAFPVLLVAAERRKVLNAHVDRFLGVVLFVVVFLPRILLVAAFAVPGFRPLRIVSLQRLRIVIALAIVAVVLLLSPPGYRIVARPLLLLLFRLRLDCSLTL